MRYIFLFFIFLGSLSAFTLKFNKAFYRYVEPKTITVQIIITAKDRSEKKLLDLLKNYSVYIKNFKELTIEGGKYTIHPVYSYENGKRYKDGYSANMNYKVSSTNEDDISSFIYQLEKKKQHTMNIDIQISDINWYLDQSQRSREIELLRDSAILWSINYTDTLSKKLSKKCTIKTINFNNPTPYEPIPMLRSAATVESAPTPIKREQKVDLMESLELECN
jgi:uncharacterized protein YggE